NIEHEPPHAGSRIKGLRHRYERHAVGSEQLDEFGAVRERAGRPIDLINQHNVDRARPDIREELLQSEPLERGAGECAVVVAGRDEAPALVRLALDIGLTGLALGIKRAEGKVEVMLARLAGIDRAARELADGAVHATEPITHRGNGSS